jgi:rRNA maturation protein Nop10
MQIVHRIALTASEADRREIDRLGIKLPPQGHVPPGFVFFDAAESDESWPAVRAWIERTHPGDFVSTKFTREEIAEARWLALRPDWHHGYPQPNAGNNGYLDVTYDLADCCRVCGIGMRQKAPFRMSGEPRWGKRGILQLNWIMDEYFATPEVWASVFEPHGVGSRPVLNGRGVAEFKTVVQLVADERVSLDTTTRVSETCPACGRVKYRGDARGPLPPLVTEPRGHIARSAEFFGGGTMATNEVIVSQALARAIQVANVRGASFRPVAAAAETVHL